MHTHQMTGSPAGQSLQAALREQDVFTVILNLLKHSAREYATAVTEASCPNVRQTMQNLLNETLSEQADCFQVMNRQGWYPPAPQANRQDVQQSVQKHRQAVTQLAQIAGQGGFYGEMGRYQPLPQPVQSYQPPAPQYQAFQGRQWNAGSGAEWETGGHAGQVPGYDPEAWRYGVHQHSGEVRQ